MEIYKQALKQVITQLEEVKEVLHNYYGYEIINSICSRIKTPQSIINKMKKKNYKHTYKNLVRNINDIAGIRIICPLKNNIYEMVKIIEKLPNIKIIKRKDYITKPKESGYSGYHLVVETPVEIRGRQVPIKVEIQIRTMAMDFWATNEHKIKYKNNKKLSFFDSKKLTIYAKILNVIDNQIMKISQKNCQ